MENSEIKNCQNCKSQFVIEPEDFSFYKKIKVPPPTFCPECRLQRRLLFMNERTFYKRACDKCGKNVISMFPAGGHKKVYCSTCWWGDDWGPEQYGKTYDFSKPFFKQFAELYAEVPELARLVSETTLVRSDYSNISSSLKDCYLVFNSDYNEECSYCEFLEESKSCIDVTHALSCERCYDGINCYKCYGSTRIFNCDECINVHFSRDLSGCSNCFGCIGLRGKQYYFFNQPLAKEDYEKKIADWNSGSYAARLEIEKKLKENALTRPYKYMTQSRNSNVTGDFIFWSKNVSHGYEIISTEDSKYCQFIIVPIKTTDSYDFTMWGGGAERIYECMGAGDGQRDVKFCFNSWSQSFNLQYCWYISNMSSSNLFGCIGLRNKEYCILNKQYTKEEYEELVPKIIKHMDEMPYISQRANSPSATNASEGKKEHIVYKYGEFFPPELSPFAYNETIAQEYLPLSETEAKSKGFRWKIPELRNYQITKLPYDLPDDIKDVNDSILEDIIGCAHEGKCQEKCTEAFKIIPTELQFYRQMNIPLPRLCPNCRHYQRIKKKNPIKLWPGKCQCQRQIANGLAAQGLAERDKEQMAYKNQTEHFHGAEHCPNEFETSYSPDRPEIVYCESCYNAEVA